MPRNFIKKLWQAERDKNTFNKRLAKRLAKRMSKRLLNV